MSEKREILVTEDNFKAIVDLFNSKIGDAATGVLVDTERVGRAFSHDDKYEFVHGFFGEKSVVCTRETNSVVFGEGCDCGESLLAGKPVSASKEETTVWLHVYGVNTETQKRRLIFTTRVSEEYPRSVVDCGAIIEEVDDEKIADGDKAFFRPAPREGIESAIVTKVLDALKNPGSEVLSYVSFFCNSLNERVEEELKRSGLAGKATKFDYGAPIKLTNGSSFYRNPLSSDVHTARSMDFVLVAGPSSFYDSRVDALIKNLEKAGTRHEVVVLPEFEMFE